eukprot:Opistho-2@49090
MPGRQDDENYEEDPAEDPTRFATYAAEGETLAKQGEYRKAIDAFTKALDLRPEEKICLVARSRCHLHLGDANAALTDAEAALKIDRDYNKGLYQKAEALYAKGDFEMALVFYHRGHKLRPELDEFRLGIQKAREAIGNSIGNPSTRILTTKVGSDGAAESTANRAASQLAKADANKPRPGAPAATALASPGKATSAGTDRAKQPAARTKQGDQTIKQLLGELYEDREYLEELMLDEEFVKRSSENMYDLVSGGISYLDTRTEFWRQQKPLYARKTERRIKPRTSPTREKKTDDHSTSRPKTNTAQQLSAQLDDVTAMLEDGEADRCIKAGKALLKALGEATVPDKPRMLCALHDVLGCAYLEIGNAQVALGHQQKQLQGARERNLDDVRSRALGNIGRVYARLGQFDKAAQSWEEKLPLSQTPVESAWLYHDIGRCHMELGSTQRAVEYGEKAFAAATEASDDRWLFNASILVAQSLAKGGDQTRAADHYHKAQELAQRLGDDSSVRAITKAMDELKAK